MSHAVRRALVSAAATAISMLALPAVAPAAIDISDVVAHPIAPGATCDNDVTPAVDAPAASHRDLCVAFDLNDGSDALKDLTVKLAPGLLGDPSATPKCTQAQFAADACDGTTRVGSIAATATLAGLPVVPGLEGEVYNLQPSPTEPARLGIHIPAVPGIAEIHLQTEIRTRLTDYGLTSITRDAPVTPLVEITEMALTLWGPDTNAPERQLPKPFVVLPTSCTPATTTIEVTSYANASDSGGETFSPTECEKVPFSPALQVGPKQVLADQPGEANATLLVPGGDTDVGGGDLRVQSHVRRVVLDLPEGLALSAPLGNGLVPCTEAQFGQFEDRTPDCPASSEIGSVLFDTPLIGVLSGKVYFGEPKPGQKLRNFVSVEDPRLRVKLVGDVTADPLTGQIRNVFDDSPQVPFTSFRFVYNGGPRAVLTGPTTCQTFNVFSPMTPWSGGAPTAPSDTFETIDCPPPMFTPTLGASLSETQAGADTGLTVRIERADRQLRLQRIAVSLPPGLAGRLGAVPACAVAIARAAACSEDSRVGSATVAVGTGPEPLSLPGRVYLTEGFNGAIAGLAVVVPARVPALDLGIVTTMAELRVRPSDAGIDVVTEDLPQIVEGVPVAYRTIDMTIDRKGFMVNRTSCGPEPLRGTFTAVGGQTATSDARADATGCDRLPFAPKLTPTIGGQGQNRIASKPQITTVVEQTPGEANTRRAEVTLPAGLGADPAALARACPEALLDAGGCPAASRIGTVTAETPLLPTPLQGPIYIVRPKSGPLPELALDLQGPLSLRLRATVGFGPGGRLKTIFDGIPDVPLRRFELALGGGTAGILSNTKDLCTSKPAMDTVFESHAGTRSTKVVPVIVPGCPKTSASSRLKLSGRVSGVAKRRPVLRLRATAPAGRKLRELRVTLPSALRARAAARRALRVLAGGKRVGKPKLTAKGRSLRLRGLPTAGARTIELRLPAGALGQRGSVRTGQVLTLKVTGIDTKGTRLTGTLRLRARR